MREPDFDYDCWALEDGEAYHEAAPDTFPIPPLAVREGLEPGDFAKLIFRMSLDGDEVAVERMWVVVTQRTAEGYLGILDNEPSLIEKNDALWEGSELPFRPLHIIAAMPSTEASLALVQAGPARRWLD